MTKDTHTHAYIYAWLLNMRDEISWNDLKLKKKVLTLKIIEEGHLLCLGIYGIIGISLIFIKQNSSPYK